QVSGTRARTAGSRPDQLRRALGVQRGGVTDEAELGRNAAQGLADPVPAGAEAPGVRERSRGGGELGGEERLDVRQVPAPPLRAGAPRAARSKDRAAGAPVRAAARENDGHAGPEPVPGRGEEAGSGTVRGGLRR